MKYAIAVVAMQDDDMEERTLQLFGPLETEQRAKVLAGYMQGRLDEVTTEHYDSTGMRFYAVVVPQHPIKVKHAVTAAKAFLTEWFADEEPDDDLLKGSPRYAYRPQEVVHSELLNAPAVGG